MTPQRSSSHRGGHALAAGVGTVLVVAMLVLVLFLPPVQAGGDYISQAPPTVYENPAMSPQTMDYDKANKTFLAHPGWINDKLIHYYKFRMYTPGTYPTRVKPGQAPDIPVGDLFLPTTTNDFTGIVAGQMPIVRWHTADGENYSDFVQVIWARVGASYVANAYKSYGDLVQNGTSLTPSGIYANVPVVPIGSRLQDPSGSGFAPIEPLMVWYRGVEIQTFVFETTSQAFADHFNPVTRVGNAALPGSGYEITTNVFVVGGRVSTLPIWHVNQYWAGVTPGVNNGGPWKGGMKNIIDHDRGDPGYTPLWQVFWVSQVPLDFTADLASNAAQITEANGFRVIQAPMFVNCPNVGPRGGSTPNPNKATTFGLSQVSTGETVRVMGALVMQAGASIDAFVGGTKVATATTAMMGGYQFDLLASVFSAGANTITVKDGSGNVLETFSVNYSGAGPLGVLATPGFLAGIVLVVAAMAVAILVQRRRTAGKRGGNNPGP
jgi:hypothetical protein